MSSKMKVGMVTTWKTQCGVGKYTEELCNHIIKNIDIHVFAEKVEKEIDKVDPSIEIPYTRCYSRGSSYEEMFTQIETFSPEVVHIQFESSMYQETYNPSSLMLKFLKSLEDLKIKPVMTFHNVLPTVPFQSYPDNNSWYNSIECPIIVGNPAVRDELLKWNPKAKAVIVPLGSTVFETPSREEALQKLNMPKDSIYVVQPGFYGADKGIVQTIKVLPTILKKYPNLKVVFAGGLHPSAPLEWKEHTKEALKEAVKLQLTKNVIFLGRFVSEEELNTWFGLADIILLNYHWVSRLYSASASAHRILCANKPIVMNKEDVRLSEFIAGVHCCKTDDEHLAQAIMKCLEDKSFAKTISDGAYKYARETSFDKIAEKHIEVYEK